MANKILIELVKKHALLNYEKSFGWSEVVECYSDADIAGIIGDAATSNEAINRMQEMIDIRDERYSEAVGPMVKCPDCGTEFGENTCCPKCRY